MRWKRRKITNSKRRNKGVRSYYFCPPLPIPHIFFIYFGFISFLSSSILFVINIFFTSLFSFTFSSLYLKLVSFLSSSLYSYFDIISFLSSSLFFFSSFGLMSLIFSSLHCFLLRPSLFLPLFPLLYPCAYRCFPLVIIFAFPHTVLYLHHSPPIPCPKVINIYYRRHLLGHLK